MKEFKVLLDSFEKIKLFVHTVEKFDKCEVNIVGSDYCVNGKSILAIISLNFRKALTVNVKSDDCGTLNDFEIGIKSFVV